MPLPTKPTNLAEWASGVGAEITEPTLSKKQAGWIAEKPPHQFFNWWQNVVFTWIKWLDSLTDQALTWTAAHIFNAAVTVHGALTATNGIACTGNETVSGSLTVSGIVAANGHVDLAGGTNPSIANSKELHRGLTCRGWARLSLDGSNAPTIQDSRNAHAVSAGGGGQFAIDFEHDLGTSCDVQITDWNVSGGTYGNRVVVTGVSVVASRTRVSCRTVNGDVGVTPPASGVTGCYIEIKSAN